MPIPPAAVAPRVPTRGPAPAKSAEPPKLDLSKYADIHITVGLIDEHVRVLCTDFEVLQIHGLLAGESVFLLVQRGSNEATIVLRGTESIRVFRTEPDAARKLPFAKVYTLEQVQRMVLEKDAKKDAKKAAASTSARD